MSTVESPVARASRRERERERMMGLEPTTFCMATTPEVLRLAMQRLG
jgi:hypothetical protein